MEPRAVRFFLVFCMCVWFIWSFWRTQNTSSHPMLSWMSQKISLKFQQKNLRFQKKSRVSKKIPGWGISPTRELKKIPGPDPEKKTLGESRGGVLGCPSPGRNDNGWRWKYWYLGRYIRGFHQVRYLWVRISWKKVTGSVEPSRVLG